jgi:hypothetical protein
MSLDRFDDLFGLYIDLRLWRAMQRKVASLNDGRHAEPDEELEYEEELPDAGTVSPAQHQQLPPPSPPPPEPTEPKQQQHPQHPGQQNGYTPPRPKRGRPPGPRNQLPGGPSGRNNNQEGF